MHSNLLADVGPDCWDRPLIVDAYDRSWVQTIRVTIHPSNIPIVYSSEHNNAVGQGSEKR